MIRDIDFLPLQQKRMSAGSCEDLQQLAFDIRRDALQMIHTAGSGHPGGVLSCIDILTVLFHRVLSPPVEPTDALSEDHFILSKGHAVPAVYAAAMSRGLLPRSQLQDLRKLGSVLQGHPDVSCLPWLEVSTGSLGQGISFACGTALAAKKRCSSRHTYVLTGDGELQEGQVWEAAMFAAHHALNNLTVIIDYNKLQSDATNEEICALEPLAEKWRAFGWSVSEVDGHSLSQLESGLTGRSHGPSAKPTVLIAHTVKGKGVDYMEGRAPWHGSVALSRGQLRKAMQSLQQNLQQEEESADVI